jgi:biopolymer transport protein ExbD
VPQPPPPGAQQNVNDTRTVVIIINRDKTMLLNAEPMDENRLGARLEEVFKTRNERVVFVKGDPDLEYQVVTRAIDIAKGAGIDKVGLMTPKVESGN